MNESNADRAARVQAEFDAAPTCAYPWFSRDQRWHIHVCRYSEHLSSDAYHVCGQCDHTKEINGPR